MPCLWACGGQQGQGCTVSQGHTDFHEISRMTVFEWKKTHTHSLSFLEQIPEQRENGADATKAGASCRASLAAGLPGLHRATGYSHPLGHLLLFREVLACASRKGLHTKIEDGHIAMRSHCPSEAGSSSAMFPQRECCPKLVSSILHPCLAKQEGKDQFCPIKLILDKIWITSRAKQIGWVLTLV